MLQHLFSAEHDRILLDERLASFHDEHEPVRIGINDNSYVRFLAKDRFLERREIYRHRLRTMRKYTGAIAMQWNYIGHTKRMQQPLMNKRTRRIDAIHHDAEIPLRNRCAIDEWNIEHGLNMIFAKIAPVS